MLLMPFFNCFCAFGNANGCIFSYKTAFSAFCISAGILVLSAYYLNPLLLGNYAMSQRNDLLIDNGVNTKTGIDFFACFACIVVCSRSFHI